MFDAFLESRIDGQFPVSVDPWPHGHEVLQEFLVLRLPDEQSLIQMDQNFPVLEFINFIFSL